LRIGGASSGDVAGIRRTGVAVVTDKGTAAASALSADVCLGARIAIIAGGYIVHMGTHAQYAGIVRANVVIIAVIVDLALAIVDLLADPCLTGIERTG
jgi:hypothetical protein